MKRVLFGFFTVILLITTLILAGCTNGDVGDVSEELSTLLYELNFDNAVDGTKLDGGWVEAEGFGSRMGSKIETDGRIWLVASEKSIVVEEGEHNGFMRFTLPLAKDEVFNYHPQTSAIELKKGTTYSFSVDVRANADSEPAADGKNYFYFAKEYGITSNSSVNVPNDNEWHTYRVNYTPEEDETWGTANGDYLFFFQNSYVSVGGGTLDIDNIAIHETVNATVDFEIDGKVVGTKNDVTTVGVSFKQLISDLDLDGYDTPTSVTYNGKTYTGENGEGYIVFTKTADKVTIEAREKSPFAPQSLGADIVTDGQTGLRFNATMKTADKTVKQAGFIVTRKAYLDYANIDARDFNAASDVKIQTIHSIYGGKKNNVVSKKGTDTLSAVIDDTLSSDFGDVMVARPFVIDKDGVWYGKAMVASAKDTAKQMLDSGDFKPEQKSKLQEIAKDTFTYITLKKQKDKDFVLVNLTDMHLMADQWESNGDDCRHYKATVNELIERVKPDLITFSGDFCFAEGGDIRPYEYHRDFIDSFGIPWTFTNGNHDVEYGDKFVNQIVDVFSEAENFIYESKDKTFGVANYVIGIEQEGQVIHSVLLMDIYDRIKVTTDEKGIELKNWKSFNPLQREWYEDVISNLEKIGCENSTLITHIPIKGFTKAYEAAFNKAYNPRELTLEESYEGDCWNEGYKDSYGIIRGWISDYGYEDDMVETISRLGNTTAVISGHDHTNNGVINYLGVDLAYSLKTGKSGKSDGKLNGGTCVIIDENGVGTVKHEYVYPEKW